MIRRLLEATRLNISRSYEWRLKYLLVIVAAVAVAGGGGDIVVVLLVRGGSINALGVRSKLLLNGR
jgi:hypothetical protein